MPKTFITERDIDDMKARGVTSLDVNDNIVLTDLAGTGREAWHQTQTRRNVRAAQGDLQPVCEFGRSVSARNCLRRGDHSKGQDDGIGKVGWSSGCDFTGCGHCTCCCWDEVNDIKKFLALRGQTCGIAGVENLMMTSSSFLFKQSVSNR